MYHPVYTLLPISVTKDTRSGRPQVERSKMRARPLITPGSKERITPRVHSLGDKSTCVPNILPTSSVVYTSVPVHGITQLGFRSHPSGSFIPEAITTFSLVRSDQPVYTIASIESLPTYSGSGRTFLTSFLTSGIPIRPVQAEFTIFTDASTQGWGAHMEDSQISSIWNYSDSRLHINTLLLKAVILILHHWVSVLRGHQVMTATNNTTVLAYINKHGGTHSHTQLHLLVHLFLWLQTHDIAILARHIPGYLNVTAYLGRLHPEIVT